MPLVRSFVFYMVYFKQITIDIIFNCMGILCCMEDACFEDRKNYKEMKFLSVGIKGHPLL